MSNKKYRLLKDLPGKPAGILLSYSATLKMYQYEGYPSVDMGDGYFVYGELPALVENNPDWFQEVVEPEPNQPEFPVEEIKALTSMYKDMIAHIRQQKYTEADMDKARRESFGAARELNKASIFPNPVYPTYEDYKKSFKK